MSTLHERLLARIEQPMTPEQASLALWSVLEQTGRALFAARNGARYPLHAEVIERHMAEALEVDGG